MKYGIVLFPSKKLQDIANSYRKRYDPNYSLIPPHLTLRTTFEASNEKIAKVVTQLREISKQLRPISIKITKFSSFAPVNNVIYMKVEPTAELTELHEKMYSGILEDQPEYAFVPHFTIAQNLSYDEHSDVLGSLKMREASHEEMVDRFHLLYQLDNGSWTVYETFILGV
ncbi:YjcG family protein [Bacillus changyiensis]|uniref:YjcG family protein n=1 Tax=Bacillus changyiensis TaxID=3004103 RepID=UPI0022E600A9|nr:YjcG family protein [Bacillus changyiensis]MDA1475875.1 YjcG family protein [Bacillus changyiensis]